MTNKLQVAGTKVIGLIVMTEFGAANRRRVVLMVASGLWPSASTNAPTSVQSYMQFHKDTVTFYGNLDIETLGGAGFASQRTASDDSHWNLREYDGILLTIDTSKSDQKRYTFILKDDLPSKKAEAGRNRSTLSWEYDFQVQPDQASLASSQYTEVYIPWGAFTPTFRGKRKEPSHPLNQKDVRQMSFMMRSFFGTQKGAFKLCVEAISAYKNESKGLEDRCQTPSQHDSDSLDWPSKQDLHLKSPRSASRWSWLCPSCCRL